MKYIITFILYLFLSSFSFAQQHEISDQKDLNNEWQLSISPYFWMTGIRGEITFNDTSQEVDARFKDLKKSMDAAFMLHIELDNGKWGLFSDILYFKYTKDGETTQLPKINTELEGSQTMAEIASFYKLITIGEVLLIDGFIGVRYTSQPNEIASFNSILIDQNSNFIDPFFGIRYRFNNGKWFNHMRFDIGGFSVGSDVSAKWNMILGYQFNEFFSLSMGFQLHQIRYEKQGLKSNLTNAGFGLGATFSI